nr:SEC-C domain-containing protein [Saprospiraceae bacterium]
VDQQVSEARAQRTDYSKTTTSRSEENMRRAAEEAGGAARQAIQTVRNAAPKVGRNDLCPCGSGKKFKNCHGNS